MGQIELPIADLSPYSDVQIRFAAMAWPMRAAEELRSALIYRALAKAAHAARIAPHWPLHFVGAMRDEIRHAELCAGLGGLRRAMADAQCRSA